MTRLEQADWLGWPSVRALVAAFEGVGPIRFIGGCVRDHLAGRAINDLDVATPVRPEAVMAALRKAGHKAIPTGLAHGTVTAIIANRNFEITTLRRDVETDGRRAVVAFAEDWAEDSARRDFTINAMAVDPDGTLYDPHGGIVDLAAGRIRFIGDAETRIREDILRIFRFFRFSAHFGRLAAGDPGALAAISRTVSLLDQLSAERVATEVLKLLAAADPAPVWRLMRALGALDPWLQEAENAQRLSAIVPLEDALARVDPLRRLSGLCEDPAGAARLGARLKLSNRDQARLVAAAGRLSPELDDGALRRQLYRHGAEAVIDRLIRRAADLGLASAAVAPVLARIEAMPVPVFPLRGQDLLDRGARPGAELGERLKRLEKQWLEEGAAGSREEWLARLD